MAGKTSPTAGCAVRAPMRTCVGCRRKREKAALLRLTERHGTVVVDGRGDAPGRGAYLCPDARCVERALRRRAAPVARALRRRDSAIDTDTLAAAVNAVAHDRDQSGEGLPDVPGTVVRE